MKKWIHENKLLPLEQILIENSKYINGTNIKKKLYKEELKEEKCELCGIGNIWNNKKLTLQLDHINGVHSDNRIENLQIICPNCHSCTENYCAKNIKLNNIKKGKEYIKNTKTYKTNFKHNCENCDKEIKQKGNCIDCSKKIIRTKNKNRPSYNQLKEDIKVYLILKLE